ncbi:MAG TPA: ECF transporter S component [Bacilli bacterium]|mgnify:CR=1 FL=1|nr:ECF transporter S component [Bacilli bacterium]HPS19104.1 ECF transporter S component [Bacilli bacterium]
MRNNKIFQMTLSAVIIAIIAVISFVPNVGYISYGIVSICTIHIIVLIVALLFGWKQGLVAGTAFGVFSLLRALTMPASSIDFAFVNPLISVLPRAAFGLLAGLLFEAAKKTKSLPTRSILFVVSSIMMTIFHTVTVLLMLWAFKSTAAFNDNFMNVLTIIISLNAVIEMVSAGIVVPLLAWPLSKAFPKYNPYQKNQDTNSI